MPEKLKQILLGESAVSGSDYRILEVVLLYL